LPDCVTLIEDVIAPFDQRYVEPALAVSVTDPPLQKVVGPEALIVASGLVLTVTDFAAEVVLQPFAFVTVTV
jgi:hypothetical protein